MRGLRAWLRRVWNGQAGVSGRIAGALLFPLEVLYRSVIGLRNRAYDLGILPTTEPPIPVISVGNVAVGGTGKTPFSGWLVRCLEEMGRRPALVTRGYGSDEVRLHRAWNPSAVVVADPQRLRGVALAAERGADVAVLDDAFQHRAIRRHVDIVLVAAEHGNRRALLPKGRLREAMWSLARADAVVITRKTASGSEAERIDGEIRGALRGVCTRIAFETSGWADLEGRPTSPPRGEDLVAVTSVADPEQFEEMVRRETSAAVHSLAFRDHHVFRLSDIRRIVERASDRSIVTTEKDAVKLNEFSEMLPATYVLRLRVAWEAGQEDLMTLIDEALEER